MPDSEEGSTTPNDSNDEEGNNENDGEGEEEDSDYLQIDSEIKSTMSDLAEPSNILLSDFTMEYEKLARAYRGAHDNEKRVEKKCATLVQDTLSIKEKSRNDNTEQDELHERKLHLTKEIETAWKGVKKAHEKSTDRSKNVVVIRQKNQVLKEQIGLGSGMTNEQKNILLNLSRYSVVCCVLCAGSDRIGLDVRMWK